MDGDVYTPDPETSAKMLNLLSEVGLVGAKLAVSHGTEASLARQLADRLGIEQAPWHVVFITGQVREAVQMADLDERVAGSSSTRSMQNVLDARAHMEKERKTTLEPQVSTLVLPGLPKRGTLGRTVRLKSGRIAAENEVDQKVLCKLVDELERFKAPVLDEIKKSRNPLRAKEALLPHFNDSAVPGIMAALQGVG